MRHIIIISKSQNLVARSIQTSLEKFGYMAPIFGLNIESSDLESCEPEYVILQIDEEMAEDPKTLIPLSTMLTERDEKVILIASPEDFEKIDGIFPDHIVVDRKERPVNVPELCEQIVEYALGPDDSHKKTILVVDDSGPVLLSIKSWLEDTYRIIMANSGTMAIKYLTLNHPDLILLDYEMPVLNGQKVLEMIRSEKEFADTPVIFLTNKNDKDIVMQVMAYKPNGYLLKTMPPEQIKAEIAKFFSK